MIAEWTAEWNLHQIWIAIEKSLVKWAPVPIYLEIWENEFTTKSDSRNCLFVALVGKIIDVVAQSLSRLMLVKIIVLAASVMMHIMYYDGPKFALIAQQGVSCNIINFVTSKPLNYFIEVITWNQITGGNFSLTLKRLGHFFQNVILFSNVVHYMYNVFIWNSMFNQHCGCWWLGALAPGYQ